MEIKRIVVDEVEAKKESEVPARRFDVRFRIKKAKKELDWIKIKFAYLVLYEDGSKIEVEGKIYCQSDKPITNASELEPEDMEKIINAINHVGTIHAIMLARTIGLRPPLRQRLLRAEKQQ